MGNVERRDFLTAAGALLAASVARAQQPGRTYVVGVVLRRNLIQAGQYRSVMREQLAKHGFVEGQNLRIAQPVFEGGGFGSGQKAARELLELKVDAIFSFFSSATEGVASTTKTVPIVFSWVSDPIRQGIVANLARPGGNVTGVSSRLRELSEKRFELALELVPSARRIAFVIPGWVQAEKSGLQELMLKLAKRVNVEVLGIPWNGSLTIEDAHKAGAQVVIPSSNLIIAGLLYTLEAWIKSAIDRRLPVVYAGSEETEAGGLMSYGTNSVADLQQATDLLARVLKGDKPGDLPVDQSSRFELVINLKTANAIGLAIPPSILLRADRVIE